MDDAHSTAGGSRVALDVDALRADPEMAGMFFADITEQLAAIEAAALQLESAPGDAALLDEIFRPFHTVKGNAAIVDVLTVQQLAHCVENLLEQCRSGQRPFGAAEADSALEAVDVLRAIAADLQARLGGEAGLDLEPRRLALMGRVAALVAGDTAETPVTPAEPARAAAGPTAPAAQAGVAAGAVKVDTRKLDNLVDMMGELVIAQEILQQDVASLHNGHERLARNLAALRRITGDLQRTAMSMRMVPIRQTFRKMQRLVRDLSRQAGKPVELVLSGEDTELDRRIVEDITDPLMHMVRNSVDHGIEDAARRTRAGKRPEGRVSLSAYHQGGNIVISLQDDGRGLDTDRILAKAVERGLVVAGAAPAPAEIHQMIFHPGFSTAEQVTDTSGRGVGMDVVRRNIEQLRGRIEIQSAPGQGTTFLIKLPLTLAILDGLILGVGSDRFVMPIYAVRESFRPLPSQVHTINGQECMVEVRGRLLPIVRLAEVFGLAARQSDVARATVVVIEDEGDAVALLVDDLLGKQDVVIKSLGDAFQHAPGVAGGAILGDGLVGLILDAHGLVRRSAREPRAA